LVQRSACDTERALIRSYGLVVELTSNRADVLAAMVERVPPLSRPVDHGRVHLRYRLRAEGECACGAEHDQPELHAGPEQIATVLTNVDALYVAFRQRLKLDVAARSPRRLFVHAGVVAWQGRAIVLPGESRAGKTTLVRALLEAGATYLSDEYAVFDRRGAVHPYPQPLGVRSDDHPFQEDHDPVRLGHAVATAAMPVGLVAVTAHVPEGAWHAAPVTRGRAVVEMLVHTASAAHNPARAMAFLDVALGPARCLVGERGEAAEAVDHLLAHLEGRCPEP
jgi:hypothetical protein